jgi:hypothetical protein
MTHQEPVEPSPSIIHHLIGSLSVHPLTVRSIMKLTILLSLLATASAFAPSPAFTTRGAALFADPTPEEKEEEEGGLDLDLDDMFDMFEAADKDQKFGEAKKK